MGNEFYPKFITILSGIIFLISPQCNQEISANHGTCAVGRLVEQGNLIAEIQTLNLSYKCIYRVNQEVIGEYQAQFGVGFKLGTHYFQSVWLKEIIGIQTHDIFSTGNPQGYIVGDI